VAQKVTVVLEDDLTGGPADQTIRFAFEGTGYEIDLNAKNAAKFSKQLAPYVEHARRAGRAQSHRPRRTAANRQRSGDIGAKAKEYGLAVSERGRIPPAWWNSTTRPAGTSTSHRSARCHNRTMYRDSVTATVRLVGLRSCPRPP